MLGFSSEGISGAQDLGSWRKSFIAAFANPGEIVPVSWSSSNHFGGEQLETNSELTNVNSCYIMTPVRPFNNDLLAGIAWHERAVPADTRNQRRKQFAKCRFVAVVARTTNVSRQ